MKFLKDNLTLILFVFAAAGAIYFVKDVLFSEPDHLEGIIIEKFFVPSLANTATTVYAGARRSNYFLTVQKEEQWVAIVKMDAGDTVKVHCKSGHYESKNIGDKIHFKKYEGKHFHIQFFAHNEEED